MQKKYLRLIASASLCFAGATAQIKQGDPTIVNAVGSASLKLRQIVLKYWSQSYTYASIEKAVPANTCVDFYNEINAFNNNSLINLSKLVREKANKENMFSYSLLENAFGSASNMASSCSYDTSTGLATFLLYKEIYDRDITFLNYVIDSY